MTNYQQEAENIRFGLDDIDARSIRTLREIAICQANGRNASAETKARLIAIEEDALALRIRKAALDGVEAPARPEWLDPLPAPPSPPVTVDQ